MADSAKETGKQIDGAFDRISDKKEHNKQMEIFEEKIKQFLGLSGAV
jgi:hypothetical protein